MYCEKCGKNLSPGEECTCHKKKEKKFNIYALISLLFFILGIEMVCYFYTAINTFLDLIPVTVITENERYISYAIIILLFLCGIISGGKAISNHTAKTAAFIMLFINLIAFFGIDVICALNLYQSNAVSKKRNSQEIAYMGNLSESETELESKKETETEFRYEQESETEVETEVKQETELQVNQEEKNEKFVVAVLEQADQLLQQGDIEKAKDILTQSYNATNNEELLKKLEEVQILETQDTEKIQLNDEIENITQNETELENTIHRYEYYLMDGTWEEAYWACLQRGGHLVTFDDQAEFDYVSQDLLDHNQQDYILYIGGRRDIGSREYYWVDEKNSLIGSVLNSSDAWNKECWLHDEPSFRDDTLGIEENVLNMFYYDDLGKWVWNDVPNDLLGAVPSYSGKVGYICEYEN